MLRTPASIGNNRIHLEVTDSTNLYASELLTKTNPMHGTVISASFQTGGKGQFGRGWYASAEKNILCSIILKHGNLSIYHQFYLNAAVSLAIRDTIVDILPKGNEVKIKWPNDIYVEKQKIAGILIQNTLMGKEIKNSIVGIGININEKSFPDEIPNATSLYVLTNNVFDIGNCYLALFKNLDYQLSKLNSDKRMKMKHEYEKGIFGYEEELRFFNILNQEEFLGRIKGVDFSGKLIIESAGKTIKFNHGEMKTIFDL